MGKTQAREIKDAIYEAKQMRDWYKQEASDEANLGREDGWEYKRAVSQCKLYILYIKALEKYTLDGENIAELRDEISMLKKRNKAYFYCSIGFMVTTIMLLIGINK